MRMYIDDIRTPKNKFSTICRTSCEAINWMKKNGCPNFISFDHDLGGDDTSMGIVKFIVDSDLDTNGKFIPEDFSYNIHSANPVGTMNIDGYLKSYFSQRDNSK